MRVRVRVMPGVAGRQYESFARAVIKSISKLNSNVVLFLFAKKLNCWLFFLKFRQRYDYLVTGFRVVQFRL